MKKVLFSLIVVLAVILSKVTIELGAYNASNKLNYEQVSNGSLNCTELK